MKKIKIGKGLSALQSIGPFPLCGNVAAVFIPHWRYRDHFVCILQLKTNTNADTLNSLNCSVLTK